LFKFYFKTVMDYFKMIIFSFFYCKMIMTQVTIK